MVQLFGWSVPNICFYDNPIASNRNIYINFKLHGQPVFKDRKKLTWLIRFQFKVAKYTPQSLIRTNCSKKSNIIAFFLEESIYFHTATSMKKRWEQTRAIEQVNLLNRGDFSVDVHFYLSCFSLLFGNVNFHWTSSPHFCNASSEPHHALIELYWQYLSGTVKKNTPKTVRWTLLYWFVQAAMASTSFSPGPTVFKTLSHYFQVVGAQFLNP